MRNSSEPIVGAVIEESLTVTDFVELVLLNGKIP